jgi:hypothetical protein
MQNFKMEGLRTLNGMQDIFYESEKRDKKRRKHYS